MPSAANALSATVAPTLARDAIAPMRVVEVAHGREPSLMTPRTCSRCRGVVDPNAQFCKFCGAPLAEQTPAPAAKPITGPTPAQTGPTPAAPAPAAKPVTGPTPARESAEVPVPSAARVVQAVPQPGPSAPNVASAPARGASRATVRARLVVIAKSGTDGPSYPITDTLDVGRVEGNVVVGEDPYLSPRHARIVWTGGKLVLRDLASTNGVYLRLAAVRDMNAARRPPQGRGPLAPGHAESNEVAVPLEDQDLILVGQQVLRFEIERQGASSSVDAGFGPANAVSTGPHGHAAVEHGTLVFGSPAGPRYARLCQRSVEGITRDVYYVRKAETVFGRESGDVVFTEDPFLSRRHAAVRVLAADARDDKQRGFALVDLGSSNGTFLRIRGEVDLAPGDQFRVGQQLFRVDFEANSKAADDGGNAR